MSIFDEEATRKKRWINEEKSIFLWQQVSVCVAFCVYRLKSQQYRRETHRDEITRKRKENNRPEINLEQNTHFCTLKTWEQQQQQKKLK